MNHIYRYKYLALNENSIKIITECTIKFSHPSEFNDPFDCNPFYNTSEINKIKLHRSDLYRAIPTEGKTPSQKVIEIERATNRLKTLFGKENFAQEHLFEDAGILCLSRNPLNILMWSHYADNHKGFLVELKIPTSSEYADMIPLAVKYSKLRPSIPALKNPRSIILDTFLTKSLDWAYEEEERVITTNRSHGIYPYPPELLNSVIAGARTSNDDYKKIKKAIKEHNKNNNSHVSLYKANTERRTFSLTVPHHPRLSNGFISNPDHAG